MRMHFQIDAHNGIAIFDQIARQMKFAVARGVLREGEMVPSVRDLSKQLTVNPNTVARAYRDLQNEGVLESVRGTGLEITAAAKDICEDDRTTLIRQRLESVLREARQSGLSATAVRQLVSDLLKQLSEEQQGEPS